ncbi:MAG TPA: DNA polymerase III subunit beta [Acidimicrobiales bacterium]|nr:DNA polymerase III subunit beta [Acidimicrobiales bacterium]
MEFRCERDVLVEALSTAQRAVTNRNAALPVLAGVRLELSGDALRVTGTDLDLFAQVRVEVVGEADGSAVVPARLAADIVRSLETGVVRVDGGDDELKISSGRAEFSVRTYVAADFPKVPAPAERSVTLPAAVLGEALRQVVRAASSDEGVPIITGVLLAGQAEGLRLVATDKYRLAVRDLPGVQVLAEGQQVLVPARALAELQRLLPSGPSGPTEESPGAEVTLRLGDHDATFEVGHARLTTRLIPGSFPDYRQLLISGYKNQLIVGKEPLLEALKRVKLLVRDTITSVRVHLQPENITLTVATADVGTATEDVDAKYEGEDLVVAFNPAYLIDGLEAIPGDEVLLQAQDKMKQVTLTKNEPGTPDYLYLLMPVRV